MGLPGLDFTSSHTSTAVNDGFQNLGGGVFIDPSALAIASKPPASSGPASYVPGSEGVQSLPGGATLWIGLAALAALLILRR